MTQRSRAGLRGLDRLDVTLLVTLGGLSALTLVVLALPDLPERIVAPSLDLALDSIALVVTSLVAMLAWIRFRERGLSIALYQAAAFVVLAITYLRAVIDTVGVDPTAPLASAEPGHEQLYVFIVGRLIAGTLLVLGGISTLRLPSAPRPYRVLTLAVASATIVALAAHPLATAVPPLIERPADGGAALVTPFGSVLHLIGAALFIGAVVACRRLWQRDRSIGDAFVAIGLLFAAFALVIGALTPGSHPGPVTIADGLWFAFDIALLLAIEAEARALLRALRRANSTLEQLRDAEVSRAALEERARLSRELHDGLTQDLWLAKLKIGRLAGLAEHDPTARALVEEATSAIDQGLSEAHQAIMAMRIASAADGAFAELLRRYAEDFEDRFGQRVQVRCDPDLPDLPVRTQAELLRIAQEALANVHRHAEADRIRVDVRPEDGEVVLVIEDDGRGFEFVEPGPRDFGLLAMRERATLISGHLRIESAPGAGTSVTVRAPVVPPASGSLSAGRPRGDTVASTLPRTGASA
ncbi:MAG TPA: sensor histidine kinase [Clostridia bacterium]|nr:sensor histidine kinase [Clostridia bacterium]